jgi:hypothetical protein
MPHDCLAPLLAAPWDATAVRVPGNRGVGAVASGALRALAKNSGPVDRHAARTLTDQIAGLVALALGGVQNPPASANRPCCCKRRSTRSSAPSEIPSCHRRGLPSASASRLATCTESSPTGARASAAGCWPVGSSAATAISASLLAGTGQWGISPTATASAIPPTSPARSEHGTASAPRSSAARWSPNRPRQNEHRTDSGRAPRLPGAECRGRHNRDRCLTAPGATVACRDAAGERGYP